MAVQLVQTCLPSTLKSHSCWNLAACCAVLVSEVCNPQEIPNFCLKNRKKKTQSRPIQVKSHRSSLIQPNLYVFKVGTLSQAPLPPVS